MLNSISMRTCAPLALAAAVIVAASALAAPFDPAPAAVNYKQLYDSHQWFALRDAVMAQGIHAPMFYLGAVEAAFNQTKLAERDLHTDIRGEPNSTRAYDAREILTKQYVRNGQYREALAQADKILKDKPDAPVVNDLHPLLEAAAKFPDQSTSASAPSTLKMKIDGGNVFIPLTINGVAANFQFDTGAIASSLSESEAKRIGLTIRDAGITFDSLSGAKVKARFAVADDLIIGNVHMSHLPFYVLPDSEKPFVGMAAGKRGLLGMPVLLALQTIRWSPRDLKFECGFGSPHAIVPKPNLAFDGAYTVVQLDSQGKSLLFGLDTGAQRTEFYPSFGTAFPALMATGKKVSPLPAEADGTSSDSIALPSVTFSIAGFNAKLEPAHVVHRSSDDASGWFNGNLGMDALNQAHTITIDFSAMSITLN